MSCPRRGRTSRRPADDPGQHVGSGLASTKCYDAAHSARSAPDQGCQRGFEGQWSSSLLRLSIVVDLFVIWLMLEAPFPAIHDSPERLDRYRCEVAPLPVGRRNLYRRVHAVDARLV